MFLGALLGALINLNGSGRYIHWGFIQISVANLVVSPSSCRSRGGRVAVNEHRHRDSG